MKTLATLLIVNLLFLQIGFGQTSSNTEELFREYGISVEFLNEALFGNTQENFSFKTTEVKSIKSPEALNPYFQTVEKQYLSTTGEWKVLNKDNSDWNGFLDNEKVLMPHAIQFLKVENISLLHEDAQSLTFKFHFQAKDLPKNQKHLKVFEGKIILSKAQKSLDKIEVYATSGFNTATVTRVRFFNAVQVYKKDLKTGLPLIQRETIKAESGTFGKSVVLDKTIHYYDYKQDVQQQNEV